MPMPEPAYNLAPLSLDAIADLIADQNHPPLDLWNPPLSGDSYIHIDRQGVWYHHGSAISRENMVRLFASILRREDDGSYVLVTPVERQSVSVEDVPFIATELKSEGTGLDRRLAFRLNFGELVIADADHPLRFELNGTEPAPFIRVRPGIEARIARRPFYDLVEAALEEAGEPLGLWSGGCFFSMAAIA
jgi:uncharacterized protein